MREAPPMMKCGHAANATNGDGNPSCVICVGIHPGAETIDESPPDLTGRKSKCAYCSEIQDSDPSLAFFEHRPDRDYDLHYDGCRGWD
jgi:hypothetical protein